MAGDIDGIGLHVLDLARAQIDSGGVRPVVVTCATDRYASRLRDAGVPFHALTSPRLADALPRALMRGLVWEQTQLTHLHGHRASQLLLVARWLPGRHRGHPLVATCHGFPGGSLRRRARARTELASYRHLRLLITTSCVQAAEAEARRHAPPVVYVPNGVAMPPELRGTGGGTAFARHRIPAGGDVVGAVGRLAREKRHDVFLDACRLIAGKRPRARFVLMGDGPERQRLEALARVLGIADRTHFTGLVDDVSAACSELSLLMHTSDTEGTPRAVLEAMAAAVPVVATAVGGVPALVENGVTGCLTAPRDTVALARASLGLLADPGRARCMGERGRLRVAASFTISGMAARVEELYRQQVLGGWR
jgi:glycosyltransferase involved in cell wall biosynthesis